MVVKSKQQMYTLYDRERFGNKLRSWDLRNLDLHGVNSVSIRYTESQSRFQFYNIGASQVSKMIAHCVASNADRTKLRFNESAPDDDLLIQGEIQRTWAGLYFRYSRRNLKMRDALLSDSWHSFGLESLMLLRRFLMPSSFADIESLLDDFPDSAIEFSAYRYPLGNLKGRNAIIWEVRNY